MTIKSQVKFITRRAVEGVPFLRDLFLACRPLLLRRYYRRNYLPLPLDEKLVLFESFLGKQYACSPKAIYEAMQEDPAYRDYRFVWVFRDVEKHSSLLSDPRTSIVRYRSKDYYKAYASAKFWVINWRLANSIIKKPNQVFIQTWHGTPLKKIGIDLTIEGNATSKQKKTHKLYLEDAKQYDYFISPSAFCTKVFSSAFALKKLDKEGILIESGYPRNDALFNRSPEEIIAIKKNLGLPLNKKLILYAPTWRDNQHTAGLGYTFDPKEDIESFIRAVPDDYLILLRLHYLVANQIDLSDLDGKALDFSSLDDINQLYLVSDLLITDYSSVFFDYANLKKPMIFYMYDLEDYQSSVRDFYIDLAELPGPIVKNQKDLLEAVCQADQLMDEYGSSYKTFNDTYTYLDDGKAGARIAALCIKSYEH